MGVKGVGYLFGLISLFLLVVCLKQTQHAELAAELGLAGGAILAVSSGRFLWRRWRTAPDVTAFHEDGDVQFALAVFLLVLLVPLVVLLNYSPLLAILVVAASIPVRTFAKRLRSR